MDLNDTGNRVIAGIVVVLLLIGAWYLGTTHKVGSSMGWSSTGTTTTTADSSASNTAQTTTGTNSTVSAADMQVGGGAITVSDQPAGSFVVVKSVTLAQPGWVAIRDAAGKTLGAGYFAAGTQTAVQVPLLRNTTSGEKYQALIYADDGDRTFDLHKDTLVMNSDGSVAGASFTATNGD